MRDTMTKTRQKVIDGKTYKRHNAYKTKREAIRIQHSVKNGVSVWYDHVRIVKDESKKVRKYVVWKHGKHISGRKLKFR